MKKVYFLIRIFSIVLIVTLSKANTANTDVCLDGDCRNGNGVIIYSDGSRYQGHFKDNLRHGYGVYNNNQDKSIYEGYWKENYISGQGTIIYLDGSKYVGNFEKHTMNGKGKYVWPKNGAATKTNKYDGDWKDGKMHGKGIYIYSNNERYEGEWLYHKKHGYGIFIYSNGDRYIGEWRNNTRFGKGKLEKLNGESYDGEWINDKKYGKGIYIYPNGDRCEGLWRNDEKHGILILFQSNGVTYAETWKNGKLLKKQLNDKNITITDHYNRDSIDNESSKKISQELDLSIPSTEYSYKRGLFPLINFFHWFLIIISVFLFLYTYLTDKSCVCNSHDIFLITCISFVFSINIIMVLYFIFNLIPQYNLIDINLIKKELVEGFLAQRLASISITIKVFKSGLDYFKNLKNISDKEYDIRSITSLQNSIYLLIIIFVWIFSFNGDESDLLKGLRWSVFFIIGDWGVISDFISSKLLKLSHKLKILFFNLIFILIYFYYFFEIIKTNKILFIELDIYIFLGVSLIILSFFRYYNLSSLNDFKQSLYKIKDTFLDMIFAFGAFIDDIKKILRNYIYKF